jgi:hypothetical protein
MMMSRKFLQAGLSVMFFGMMMQRTFQQLATQSLTTFNKMNADTEAANNTMNRLGAAIDGVRYVIGDAINAALEPMEGFLMNILDAAIDFIDQNQEWIGFAVIIGIIVGGLMALVGQFGLLIIGLSALTGTGGFSAMGGAATTATAAGSKGLIGMIGTIAAVIAIWGILIGLFTGQEWARKLLTGVLNLAFKIIATIVMVATKIVQFFVAAAMASGQAIGEILTWAFKGAINGIIWGINQLLKFIETALNKVLGNELVQWGLKKLGIKDAKINLGQIGYLQNEAIGTRLSGVVDNFVSMVQQDLIDKDKVFGAIDWVTSTIGVGLERMFAKNEETTEKQTQAASDQVIAAQMNQQSASIIGSWLSQAGTPTSGSATASVNNGTLFYGFSSQI